MGAHAENRGEQEPKGEFATGTMHFNRAMTVPAIAFAVPYATL